NQKADSIILALFEFFHNHFSLSISPPAKSRRSDASSGFGLLLRAGTDNYLLKVSPLPFGEKAVEHKFIILVAVTGNNILNRK
ncbi:MAG: hypothetical protein WAT59_08650, partial [Blautia wexlerae]